MNEAAKCRRKPFSNAAKRKERNLRFNSRRSGIKPSATVGKR